MFEKGSGVLTPMATLVILSIRIFTPSKAHWKPSQVDQVCLVDGIGSAFHTLFVCFTRNLQCLTYFDYIGLLTLLLQVVEEAQAEKPFEEVGAPQILCIFCPPLF